MAVACITSIKTLMFSYEFQYLEFSADCPLVKIALADSNNSVIFSGEYIPDGEGAIKLYDLNEIVDAYVGTAPSAVLKVICTDLQSNQAVTYSTTVLRSSVAYNSTAEEFISTHFLTSSHAKHTAMGRYECLNFFAKEAKPVKVNIDVDNKGSLNLVSVTLKTACNLGMNFINVSPGLFTAVGTIIGYTVICGDRQQKYIIDRGADVDPAIAYRNRFNVWDTFYFTGTKESDPQFERSQAWINGQYLTYSVKEVLQFKAMTGVVPVGGEEYLHDIARSPEIRLLDSQGAMRDLLTVVDCDIKAVNDDNALNRYTVTYRHADKVSAKSFAPVATRIFDDSFDDSYE